MKPGDVTQDYLANDSIGQFTWWDRQVSFYLTTRINEQDSTNLASVRGDFQLFSFGHHIQRQPRTQREETKPPKKNPLPPETK